MGKIKKAFTESCSFNFIFLSKNHFQDDTMRICTKKMTSNFENALFLSSRHQSSLKNINISSEYVDFHAKRYKIFRVNCQNFTNGLALIEVGIITKIKLSKQGMKSLGLWATVLLTYIYLIIDLGNQIDSQY